MSQTKSMKKKEHTNNIPYKCKICDALAFHSNYGTITCSSCKMFFKRHAPIPEKNHSCRWNNQCEININTRQVCSACRLKKCFAYGMQVELIRCPLSKTSRNHTAPNSNKRNNDMRVVQLSTLNLLQRDQSTLTLEQWTRISNIVHCFDEYSDLAAIRKFFAEQNLLPLKLRYKTQSVSHFLSSNLIRIQQVLDKNGDYASLCVGDRLTLLHHTIRQTSCLGGVFLMYQAETTDDPYFYQTSEILFGEKPTAMTRTIMKWFDPDPTVMKLILPIVAFSTISYTTYQNQQASHFKDVQQILRIQNVYIELTWRYMNYRYSYEETIKRFERILRCLFNVTLTIVEVNRNRLSINVIDEVLRNSERIIAKIE